MLPQFIYYIHSSSLCTPIQMSYFLGLSSTHCHRESCLLIFHSWQLHLCFIVQLGIWAWSLGNSNAHAHTWKYVKYFLSSLPKILKYILHHFFFYVVHLMPLFHYCHLAHFLQELTDHEGQNPIMWSTVLTQRNAPKSFMSWKTKHAE